MKTEQARFHLDFCPKCGCVVDCIPAISRTDGLWICSDCGTREALDSIGISGDEQSRIISAIHRSGGFVQNQ